MAHTNGPIKGLIVFTCPTLAVSSSYVVEPLELSAADYAIMEAGSGTFTGSLMADAATNTHYAALTNGSVDSVPIEAVYLGKGDAAEVTFGITLTGLPVKPSTLTITAGAITGTADATGAITGTGVTSGSVSGAGVVTITFDAAPAANVPVLLAYTRGV